jgi:hypothetical protein
MHEAFLDRAVTAFARAWVDEVIADLGQCRGSGPRVQNCRDVNLQLIQVPRNPPGQTICLEFDSS